MIITQWRPEWPGHSCGAGGNGTGSSPRFSGQGQVKVACWASAPPSHSVINSFFHAGNWLQPGTQQHLLCLVSTGDKARADGRVVVLAPQEW